MGRFATAAIIALALAGAAVESHADDLTGAAPARGPAPPSKQFLADAPPGNAGAPMPAVVAPEPGAPQPGGPQPVGPMGAMPRPPGPDGMGWGGRPDMHPDMWRMHQMAETWGLFFNQRDKNLSNSDIQVLAQAILLMHGNHAWKVIDVADAADGQATFAYSTSDGSVIARFEIDRHSGRIMRIG
ncbi:hypothetical protein [Acidisoma sp.]|uniref:hypothetical protein n=1 Tax=Acidisoma sp. TaxID=1872115 RepID=UPI003B00762E